MKSSCAFQTWAVQTNLNIGLVADGGQPLGTNGAVQGDARFGDIRVAAAPRLAGTWWPAPPRSAGRDHPQRGPGVQPPATVPHRQRGRRLRRLLGRPARGRARPRAGPHHAAGSVLCEAVRVPHRAVGRGRRGHPGDVRGARPRTRYDAAGGNNTLGQAVPVPRYRPARHTGSWPTGTSPPSPTWTTTSSASRRSWARPG